MDIGSSSFNSSAFERLGISVRSASIPQETVDYFRKQQEADARAGKAAPLTQQIEADGIEPNHTTASANVAFLAQLLVQLNSAVDPASSLTPDAP